MVLKGRKEFSSPNLTASLHPTMEGKKMGMGKEFISPNQTWGGEVFLYGEVKETIRNGKKRKRNTMKGKLKGNVQSFNSLQAKCVLKGE